MAPTKAPTVSTLIVEAINALKVKGSAKGVSRSAIKSYIGDRSTVARINLALKRLVAKETLVQVKDSFKLSAKAKAAEEKKSKPAKKTTATKKTTTTKKKSATKPKKVLSTNPTSTHIDPF